MRRNFSLELFAIFCTNFLVLKSVAKNRSFALRKLLCVRALSMILSNTMFLLLTFSICLASYADEKKFLLALIDFADETPNKMAIMPNEKTEDSKASLSEVMKIVRDITEKSELFELLPHKAVAEVMNTQIGKEAAARRFDQFSAVRLGKVLGVDAILTGEIVQFEKNVIKKDFFINGLDFSNRIEDVVIKARLINAHTGKKLAEITGTGNADENLLETISAVITNRLSYGFQQAVTKSTLIILKELESANIIIDKEHTPINNAQIIAESSSFTVIKTEGKYIYINAGRNKDVSIMDLFVVLKGGDAGGLTPAVVYRVLKVDPDSSQLLLVESTEAQGAVRVGAKVKRKTRGAAVKYESSTKLQNNETKKPKRQSQKSK
jgi:hypothetical protein